MLLRTLLSKDFKLLWLVNLGCTVSFTTFSVLYPLYVQSLGFSEGTNGFILGVTSLGMLVSLLLMGPWIDRGDSQRYLFAGSLLWALASLLVLLPPSMPFAYSALLLSTVRFAQGFGFGVFYTAMVMQAVRSVSEENRGTVVGVAEGVGAFSISLTPFLALWLRDTLGYRLTFAAAIGLAVVMALVTLLMGGRRRAESALAVPVRRAKLLSAQAVLPGLVAAALFFAAGSYISLSPLIAQKLGVASISLYVGLRAFCTVPTRMVSGLISDRYGGAWTVLPGFVMAILAMVLLPLIRSGAWVFLVPVLLGLGMGIASPALTNWMLRRVDPSEHAVAVNTLTLMGELSGFFGTWSAGLLLQQGIMPGTVLAVVLAAGLVLYQSVGGLAPARFQPPLSQPAESER